LKIFSSPSPAIFAVLLVAGASFGARPALAQQGPGWFVPGGQQPRAGAAPARRDARPAARVAPTQEAVPPPVEIPSGMAGAPVDNGTDAAQTAQIPQAPVPDLPPLPKGATPPAAVIGVLGVPEIMRGATAAQEVEKVIAERREKLSADAQKEQAAWRDMQQALSEKRASMTAEQVKTAEQTLQERITNAQKSFRDRNRILQETEQYSLSQIERQLIAVIRQVAESRGMNLVLHRSQVALNVNEFDITDQVTAQLNKLMPGINIAPDGVSPVAVAQSGAGNAAAQPQKPTPASAPPSPPATRR
jgi:Skp family chaperone for outer membrane proteins